MKKKYIYSIWVILFLCLLIFFPSEALAGGKAGLLLWFQTILPTLLPFLIVSNLMIQLHIAELISSFFYPFAKHFLPITKNGCYPIMIGLLSGYPVGAKACADLVKANKISKKEGQFLLSLCNNASPMFLISYICLQSLNRPDLTLTLFLLILFGSLTSSLLVYQYQRIQSKKRNKVSSLHACSGMESDSQPFSFIELVDCSILKSFEIITKIGGYIILFSILAQIIASFTFLPETISCILIGILEITTGIHTISQSLFPIEKKIVLILTITAFGGLSSLAQTKSVIIGSGLSIRKYGVAKIINALLLAGISFLIFY